jgi:hypothetical protein
MSWMQRGLDAIVISFNAIARSIVEEGPGANSGSKFREQIFVGGISVPMEHNLMHLRE